MLTAGVVLASFVCRFPVSAGAYLCTACMFLLLCALLFKLFNSLAELKNNLNTDVFIEEVREPIDFDHPLFYSFLGFPVSFLCILLLKLIENMDLVKGKYILFGFAVYLFSAGLYFLFKKPVSKRYGNTKHTADYIIGLLMVSALYVVCLRGFLSFRE